MDKRTGLIILSVIVLLIMLLFPLDLLMVPNVSPLEYLELKPFVEVGNITVIVPSSTIIVYILGIVTIFIGIKLFRNIEPYKRYWGIALILWGIGTILAGTSYQGLGYQLKCEGQTLCLFTSWFELSYLYVTGLSIMIMGYAVALKSVNSDYIKRYSKIIYIGFIIYTLSLITGVIFSIKFLVTYEWFLLLFLPYFISFMVINVKRFRLDKTLIDKKLMNVWISMLVINILYFVYFYSGIAELLYNDFNIWFSANDVLHVGLIPWMIYIYHSLK